jgi:hypothetical protein
VRVRFVCLTAFNGTITFQNLLDIINVGATAITAFDLFTAVRVKRVDVWANALANASATVTVVFEGGTAGSVGDQKVHTSSSMGIEPARVRAAPLPLSGAALFQQSSNAVAFDLICPAGAVIDLELSYRNPIAGAAIAVQNAPAAAVAGVTYFRGLDGQALATSKFQPQGVQALD